MDQQLKQALELHQQNKLEAALQLYETVLGHPSLRFSLLKRIINMVWATKAENQSNASLEVYLFPTGSRPMEQSWQLPDGFRGNCKCSSLISQGTHNTAQLY